MQLLFFLVFEEPTFKCFSLGLMKKVTAGTTTLGMIRKWGGVVEESNKSHHITGRISLMNTLAHGAEISSVSSTESSPGPSNYSHNMHATYGALNIYVYSTSNADGKKAGNSSADGNHSRVYQWQGPTGKKFIAMAFSVKSEAYQHGSSER